MPEFLKNDAISAQVMGTAAHGLLEIKCFQKLSNPCLAGSKSFGVGFLIAKRNPAILTSCLIYWGIEAAGASVVESRIARTCRRVF